MKTDDVCGRYAGRKIGLTVRLLDEVEPGEPPDPHVLIEGSPEALRFVAELLLAVADDPEGDGFGISPVSAGKAHFSRAATHGFYLHRLDATRASRRTHAGRRASTVNPKATRRSRRP